MSEQEPENSINPYAVPISSSAIAPDRGNQDPLPPPQLSQVFFKWLVICAIAAAPSFVIGGSMGNWRTAAVLGMVIGVLIFVVGYTALEFTTAIQEQMQKPVSRRASWIAYLTRVAISIVYPVGVFVDILCGVFAIGLSTPVTGIADGGFGRGEIVNVSEAALCFQFALTTVFQGVLLNLVLFAYMGIVWVICSAIMRD